MVQEKGYQAAVICSEDSNMFIVTLVFNDKIGASLFQKCGTRTKTRIVDVGKFAGTVGIIICFLGLCLICKHIQDVILSVPLQGKGK